MPVLTQKTAGLTGNQLKVLAMLAMTCDHIGLQLLPQFGILRVIGRLSLPIYAYMIAEGCRYTHNRQGYLLRLAGLAAVCQIVYFFAMGSVYQCILVTFSMSVCLIYSIDFTKTKQNAKTALLTPATAAGIIFICLGLPKLLPGTDFEVDYGLFGVLLPVLVYYGSGKKQKTALLTLGLLLLSLTYGGNQWWALAAVPLLLCYNGQRGKIRMGMLFYLYYPLHLAVIYTLSLLL